MQKRSMQVSVGMKFAYSSIMPHLFTEKTGIPGKIEPYIEAFVNEHPKLKLRPHFMRSPIFGRSKNGKQVGPTTYHSKGMVNVCMYFHTITIM